MIIYKYEIGFVNAMNVVTMPKKHEILAFKEQNGRLFIWALVDQNSEEVRVDFLCVGTGIEFPEASVSWCKMEYIDTVVSNSSHLVWHLFKATREV